MKKQIFVALSLAAAGCFGSDPNMNSQLAKPDASMPSGGIDPNKPIVGTPVATFDTGLQGYIVDPYHDTNQTNLADPAVIGQRPGMEMPTLSFESGMGSPSPGCVKIVAPYFGASQFVQLESMSFGTSNTRNWTGGKLHLRIQVIAGTFTGGAQVYVKTGSAYVFGGTYFNFAHRSFALRARGLSSFSCSPQTCS